VCVLRPAWICMFAKTGGNANNMCSQKHLIAPWFCEWLQKQLKYVIANMQPGKKDYI
jgi:hypothetical protein